MAVIHATDARHPFWEKFPPPFEINKPRAVDGLHTCTRDSRWDSIEGKFFIFGISFYLEMDFNFSGLRGSVEYYIICKPSIYGRLIALVSNRTLRLLVA